jgi:hypothetical protein
MSDDRSSRPPPKRHSRPSWGTEGRLTPLSIYGLVQHGVTINLSRKLDLYTAYLLSLVYTWQRCMEVPESDRSLLIDAIRNISEAVFLDIARGNEERRDVLEENWFHIVQRTWIKPPGTLQSGNMILADMDLLEFLKDVSRGMTPMDALRKIRNY